MIFTSMHVCFIFLSYIFCKPYIEHMMMRVCEIGVWFMHCHFEVHLSWGLKMAWIVLDGKQPNQKLPPPPSDFPKC